jgi:hypothetical protein
MGCSGKMTRSMRFDKGDGGNQEKRISQLFENETKHVFTLESFLFSAINHFIISVGNTSLFILLVSILQSVVKVCDSFFVAECQR